MVVHRRKKGKGIIDTLKKAYSHAQTGLKAVKAVSDITGVKPSAHIKQKLISNALKSAGLGRKHVHHRKRGGCVGNGAKGDIGNMHRHMAEVRAHKRMGGRRVHHMGGLQTQSGVNNYPNAASIGVVKF